MPYQSTFASQSGHPDPDTQAEFYQDVTVKRVIAWVIDVIVITALSVLVGLLTFGIGFFLYGLIYLVIGFSYRTMTITNKSATFGMRLVAIEMRDHRGQKLDRSAAMLHTGAYYVSITTLLLQAISVTLMLTTSKGQGLGDLLTGVVTINRPSAS